MKVRMIFAALVGALARFIPWSHARGSRGNTSPGYTEPPLSRHGNTKRFTMRRWWARRKARLNMAYESRRRNRYQ